MTGAAIIIDRSRHVRAGRLDPIVLTPPSTALRTPQTIAPGARVALIAIPSPGPGATRQIPARHSRRRQALRVEQSP
jgi:hypothetical protein